SRPRHSHRRRPLVQPPFLLSTNCTEIEHWLELLPLLEKKYGADRYEFENNWVPTKPALNNYKIITNPRSVFAVSVHGVLKSQRSCAWVDRKMARMYHVKPRGKPVLEPQQLTYDGRLLSCSACLASAVNTVLRETGLLPADGAK
ncbi:hypothetical protein CHARACLAT_029951, partial [Characodon lateralis]|nr:hypothetical protein [Characodon lateralis]